MNDIVAMARKIKWFCNELDCGCDLEGQSLWLMVDTWRLASHVYEVLNESMISDGSYDRLAVYLMANAERVRTEGIRYEVSKTGMGVKLDVIEKLLLTTVRRLK